MTGREPDIPEPHVLREYALLADGERGVLVGPRGELAWMCFPHWHSEAVLSSLLGGAGVYALRPRSRFVWGGTYEEGSLIWRSRWVTERGIVECREALAFPGEPKRATLLRRVVGVKGDHRLDVGLDLRAGFGAHALEDLAREGGRWRARTGEVYLRWSGVPGAEPAEAGDGATLLGEVLDLAEGETTELVLELALEPWAATPRPMRA